ncbi:hypothetical protein FQZ97_1048800 [compost metagenome]
MPARVDITARPTSNGCGASGSKPNSNTTKGTLPIRLLASSEAVASPITPSGTSPYSRSVAASAATSGRPRAAPVTTNNPANSNSRLRSTLCT